LRYFSNFMPPKKLNAHFLYVMNICAWCNQEIEIESQPGKLAGKPATSYGICSDCLITRLTPISPRLEKREMARARRMQRCGQSLAHIGNVLGVSLPMLRVVFPDASVAAAR
jgi:hypothetical protein